MYRWLSPQVVRPNSGGECCSVVKTVITEFTNLCTCGDILTFLFRCWYHCTNLVWSVSLSSNVNQIWSSTRLHSFHSHLTNYAVVRQYRCDSRWYETGKLAKTGLGSDDRVQVLFNNKDWQGPIKQKFGRSDQERWANCGIYCLMFRSTIGRAHQSE